ncbi:hypothetical protein BN1088_1432371 [Sphingobacterium sp. PM2-P1-29]|nr:hypothetical protein BN1088_1432371 [Sphingobacterium sp. PM2-P1-29]
MSHLKKYQNKLHDTTIKKQNDVKQLCPTFSMFTFFIFLSKRD